MSNSKISIYDNKKIRLKTLKERKKLYDRLYDIGNFLLKKYNPCKIKDNDCAATFYSFCCSDCKYLTNKGCSVKCLWCKLWMCDAGSDYLRGQLWILNAVARINSLEYPRKPKEYAMKQLSKKRSKLWHVQNVKIKKKHSYTGVV